MTKALLNQYPSDSHEVSQHTSNSSNLQQIVFGDIWDSVSSLINNFFHLIVVLDWQQLGYEFSNNMWLSTSSGYSFMFYLIPYANSHRSVWMMEYYTSWRDCS
ncbi:unnamed protein product [Lactuca virosa]|uniref:Uncharacterized protein n=1 Tax=Lactuca virosa TaxID=75947 RepID=A0AAU9MVT6_9ASTR|nr:unnamed protein product [Lactuca virosa]